MSSAATVRAQVEAALAVRIPYALRLAPQTVRPVAETGISTVDRILEGGLPLGAITEVGGSECSGRTSFTMSFLARLTQSGKVCAWIDVSNALHPESAAAAGIELSRLLWVRCGVAGKTNAQHEPPHNFALPEKYLVPPTYIHGLHGGGCGGHPRAEVKGLAEAVGGLLRQEKLPPEHARSPLHAKSQKSGFTPAVHASPLERGTNADNLKPRTNLWARIDQALRVVDLLLQGGGFSAIVLDMAGVAPEFTARIPLATWFRYRAAAERSQTSVLLLTQQACAKSSAALVLRLHPGEVVHEQTLFIGVEHRLEVARQRFAGGVAEASTNCIPLRKPPGKATMASWQSSTSWAVQG